MQSDTVDLEENTQHRVSFTFTPVGGLTPGSPISLRIRGEANGPVDVGSVVLTLPTKAAMDNAGTDRQPYYPQNTAHPEVGRWDLPAMAEGDVWERTVSLPAMAKAGYYLVSLSSELQGPESDTGPFTIDDVYAQAWMLVSDTNGHLTDFFEDSVFPLGAFPMPGPFTFDIPVSGRGGGIASHNEIYLNVVYHRSRFRPAIRRWPRSLSLWARLSRSWARWEI